MSHLAADFPTQASNSVLSKVGRQSHAASRAPSGQFDDLLNAIPDAAPEPRERAAAPEAPERPQPAEARSERPRRAERTERTERAERHPATDTRTDNSEAAAIEEDAPVEAAPTKGQSTADGQSSATEKPVEAGATDAEATDSEAGEPSTVTQAAVNTLVPQATVIDPAVAVAGEVSLEGEPAAKAGTGKSDANIVSAAATKAGEQQAAVLADQTTGLSAEDAEVLSVLAAKAIKTVKDGQSDKPVAKTEADKPAHATKLTGDAATPAAAGAPTPSVGGETETAGAKPVQSESARVGAEHQRGQGDSGARPGAEQTVATAATTTTAAVKAPDTFATHMMSPAAPVGQATAAMADATSKSTTEPVAISEVGVEVTAKIASGKNQFDIRLDPEELGRIHVRVNVDRDGNITTHMMADRPETLDLLRRDIQGLERALQDAGLKTSDNSLQFSLRDQAQQQQQQNQNDGQASRRMADDEATTTLTTTVIARDYGRYGARPSGLDIRV